VIFEYSISMQKIKQTEIVRIMIVLAEAFDNFLAKISIISLLFPLAAFLDIKNQIR
jgi:hypothetical protein